MVATKEDVQFDFNADFCDSNYKSCFARSVVVNSQFHSKSLDFRQLQKVGEDEQDKWDCNNAASHHNKNEAFAEVFKPKKESQLSGCPPGSPPPINLLPTDISRRLSCPVPPSKTTLPLEHLALQSQLGTLHWQLKQTESSRQMYRAVMQQVVSFLERAHRSLEQLAQQQREGTVHRSRSEYHVAGSIPTLGGSDSFSDWRRPRKHQLAPDDVPPEKLSQEAFRLLRTVQSLIGTREPDLAHVSEHEKEFLDQLAKEFPSRPNRAASFSVATQPQMLSRKFSLQRFTRTSPVAESRPSESKRSSIISIPSSMKTTLEKPPSPKTGSVSSAEDESGFSSMNSFQEVGLPLINSTAIDNGNLSVNSSDSNLTQIDAKDMDQEKLIWNRPEIGLPIAHRRWSSTPVEVAQNEALKVLWV